MTKAEIVQALYTRVGGFSKKESADIVDMVFEMMKETLGHGEKIKISGFGNFVLRDKRQRPGRNPQTGDPIKISERRVLTFKASQILKQALNPRHAGLIEDEDDDDEADDEAASLDGHAAAAESPAIAARPHAEVPVHTPAPLVNEAPKE
jgi:integration host factor subunit alpha